MILPDESDVPMEDNTTDMDIPLEFSEGSKSRPKELENMYTGHAAALKADIEESTVFESYQTIDQAIDPRANLANLARQRSEVEVKGLEEYFSKNLGETPEDVALNVEAYQSLVQEEQASSGVPEKQVVAAMSGLGVDQDVSRIVESEMKLINVIDDIVQDYTLWEKVKDFGKAFIPGAVLVDNFQITEGMNPFSADDFLRDIVVGMKDLKRNDPEKFDELLPVFKDHLAENLPKGKQLEALISIIDTAGEENLGSFSDLSAGVDVFDVSTLGIAAALSSVKMVSKLNSVRTLNRLNNRDTAADLNTAAMMDETGQIAESAGVSSETVQSNAAPFNVGDIDPAYTAGLSSASIDRILKVKEQQRQTSAFLNTEGSFLREDLLTPAERLVAEERFVSEMSAEGIENVTVLTQAERFTTFSYDRVDPVTGEKVQDTARLDLQVSDVTGVWENTEEGLTASWLTSPTVFAKNSKDAVDSAIRLDSTSAVVRESLLNLQRDALSPILGKSGMRGFVPSSKKELMELDEVLRAGDEYVDANGKAGKVYTVDELRGGVVNGRPLNDRQIETYYNLRGLYDELWVIRNHETRRTLTSQGKREVLVGDKPQIGKDLSKEGAVGLINQNRTVIAYDSTIDEVVELKATQVKDLYDERSAVLAKLDEPMTPDGYEGQAFDFVITHRSGVRELPQKVLHFREGYVPKVNKDARWFVKETGDVVINGITRTNQITRTVRMFASKHEADVWMRAQNNDKYVLLPDRAMEQQILGTPDLGSGGGLYTGPRSSQPIPFGPEGTAPQRLNTYEALNTNLNSLENYITRNQWRMSLQQKWINSAKAAGFKNIDRFEKALIPEGDPRGAGLRKLADQIEIWSGFPTKGELAWDGFVSGVMEWALKKTDPGSTASKTIVRGANYLRDRGNDPVSLARNTAFHSLLGVFNPSQLWVQAQGAAMAASLSNQPLKTFRMQSALAVASNYGKDSLAFNVTARASGVDVDELKTLTDLWKKTGLESSILNTADHAAAAVGVGTSRAALRRVFDKGLLLYRMGELFNRRYSFLVAAERLKRTKGNYNFSDAELKEVLTDANNLMLNLSKANKASWQRGVVSVPTQFLQVQAKFLETISGANKRFTVAERGRILTGQMVLYGAAGIPLGNLGVRWATEVLGMDQHDMEQLPEAVVNGINEGMWGIFAKQWLGSEIDMANRGAISAGMTEFTMDLMFSEASIGEKAVGAFGMVPHRFFKAWKTIKPMLLSDSENPITKEEVILGLNAIGSITSTWNNAQKGLFMQRYNQLNDSKGNLLMEDFDFKSETEFMVMLGFQPSEVKLVADREALVRSRREYKAQITSDLMLHYWNYVQIMKATENEKEKEKIIERYTAGTKVLMNSLRNEGERQEVREALRRRLLDDKDRRSKSIREFIETFSDGQVVAAGSLVEASKASGIITNDLDLEDDSEEDQDTLQEEK